MRYASFSLHSSSCHDSIGSSMIISRIAVRHTACRLGTNGELVHILRQTFRNSISRQDFLKTTCYGLRKGRQMSMLFTAHITSSTRFSLQEMRLVSYLTRESAALLTIRTVISITSHGGSIANFLEVVKARDYALPTGGTRLKLIIQNKYPDGSFLGILPVVVKGTMIQR